MNQQQPIDNNNSQQFQSSDYPYSQNQQQPQQFDQYNQQNWQQPQTNFYSFQQSQNQAQQQFYQSNQQQSWQYSQQSDQQSLQNLKQNPSFDQSEQQNWQYPQQNDQSSYQNQKQTQQLEQQLSQQNPNYGLSVHQPNNKFANGETNLFLQETSKFNFNKEVQIQGNTIPQGYNPTSVTTPGTLQKLPALTSMPGANVPGLPGIPGLPGMPGVPSMPGMPNMPGMHGIPGTSGMPSMPGMPGMPGMPSLPGMPGMPGMSAPPVYGINPPIKVGLNGTIQRSTLSNKEKQLEEEISELTQKVDNLEQENRAQKNKLNSIIDNLKSQNVELESEISYKNGTIQTLKQEINTIKLTLDKLQREKKMIQDQKDTLESEFEDLNLKMQALNRRGQNSTHGPQQIDQVFLLDQEKQVQKQKDDMKKQRDAFNCQIKQLQDELDEYKQQLEKKKDEVEQEHNYYLDAKVEIANLKKTIKGKEDTINRQDQQQNNIVDSLRSLNNDKQKLQDQIKEKDFELQFCNDEIKNLKQQNDYLKNILLSNQNGQKIDIQHNQEFKNMEQQQQWLAQKKINDKKKMQQDQEIRDQERKEKLERDQKKKQDLQQQNKEKIKVQLVKGNQQMQNAKRDYGQLDVCFVVDVTQSMDAFKDQTKKSVKDSLNLIKQATNRDTNWASVCYQDIAELKQLNGQYQQFPFSKDSKSLETWFEKIKCYGGGDIPEDIRGALKQVCKLNWPSRFRIAILICDAPCHGKRYNGGCGDTYPNDDIQDAIEELIEKNIILIGLNFTRQTSIMYQEIKKIYESKKKQDLFLFQDLQNIDKNQMANIMSKYIGEASENATQTNKNQTKSKQGAAQQVVPREKEGAMEALCKQGNFYNFEKQENVQTVQTQFQVLRVEIKQEAFDRNIETIELIQCPQDFLIKQEGTWNCIRTQKPFAFGMMKDVFLMKKLNGNSEELYVIKTPIGSLPYSNLNVALSECKSHLICQKLMKKFVNELQEQAEQQKQNIIIPPVIYSDFLILQESQNAFWIAERFFKGEFVKYNNNFGFIHEDNELILNKFAQTFSFYTYFRSNFNYMVSDVQGVGNYFTDPAINTQKGSFDDTDMGLEGQMMYLVNYDHRKQILTQQYLRLLGIYE